jgi:hypothetical protein
MQRDPPLAGPRQHSRLQRLASVTLLTSPRAAALTNSDSVSARCARPRSRQPGRCGSHKVERLAWAGARDWSSAGPARRWVRRPGCGRARCFCCIGSWSKWTRVHGGAGGRRCVEAAGCPVGVRVGGAEFVGCTDRDRAAIGREWARCPRGRCVRGRLHQQWASAVPERPSRLLHSDPARARLVEPADRADRGVTS